MGNSKRGEGAERDVMPVSVELVPGVRDGAKSGEAEKTVCERNEKWCPRRRSEANVGTLRDRCLRTMECGRGGNPGDRVKATSVWCQLAGVTNTRRRRLQFTTLDPAKEFGFLLADRTMPCNERTKTNHANEFR
jgi:hypothetical protein